MCLQFVYTRQHWTLSALCAPLRLKNRRKITCTNDQALPLLCWPANKRTRQQLKLLRAGRRQGLLQEERPAAAATCAPLHASGVASACNPHRRHCATNNQTKPQQASATPRTPFTALCPSPHLQPANQPAHSCLRTTPPPLTTAKPLAPITRITRHNANDHGRWVLPCSPPAASLVEARGAQPAVAGAAAAAANVQHQHPAAPIAACECINTMQHRQPAAHNTSPRAEPRSKREQQKSITHSSLLAQQQKEAQHLR